MNKADEKKWRAAFRKAVLERDGYRCKSCGEVRTDKSLDPHHITDRHDMPNGGYCPENGITLCKEPVNGCHELAEQVLQRLKEGQPDAEQYAPDMLPQNLYRLIGSSYEQAVEAAKRLSDD